MLLETKTGLKVLTARLNRSEFRSVFYPTPKMTSFKVQNKQKTCHALTVSLSRPFSKTPAHIHRRRTFSRSSLPHLLTFVTAAHPSPPKLRIRRSLAVSRRRLPLPAASPPSPEGLVYAVLITAMIIDAIKDGVFSISTTMTVLLDPLLLHIVFHC
ncbi:hypothetical protein PIB30_001044 [Stylosanthes scabra]|uniref:Uncharacterized protein n=1 Tax=Stylosanthes scabra TaxID=79078 RepID=A0ABU6T2F2_9FABA|nr:hypothetical protein [Stylosanthes scabra]